MLTSNCGGFCGDPASKTAASRLWIAACLAARRMWLYRSNIFRLTWPASARIVSSDTAAFSASRVVGVLLVGG